MSKNNRRKSVTKAYILSREWINDFEMLLARHSELWIYPDLIGMTTFELWGVYQYLLNYGSLH